MNTSGEAADQVVRMALQTGEVALKITGAGAKQLAVLIYAILKEQKKSKGRARLETLVRTGKPLTVFSVKESDIKEFVKEAKRYGVLYCAVRNPRGSKDGMVDLIVKEEDASRINRIVERFKFASVSEVAKIKSEIVRSWEEKGKMENPFPAKTEKSRLSEPTSGRHSKAEEGTSKSADTKNGGKPSVRQELKEIQERRKAQGERAGLDQNRGERKEKETSSKNQQKSTRHRQPVRKKITRGKAR